MVQVESIPVDEDEGQPDPAEPPRSRSWLGSSAVLLHLGLAAVAYLPLLITRPGWVSADTKVYLYLDPGQLLSRARSMWDASVGMGTVPHQRIGFLWPMGPFYWLTDTVGLPDWVAQRLWWGSIMFAAGAGVAYLLRVLGWRGPAVTAAVFIYAFSPVILTLVARLSGVLLPFAGLPWLVALAIQTVRHRGWRHAALFALAVATFGSVNATGLLLVGVAPVLWLGYAVWGSREASWRQAGLAVLKIGLLTLAVSAWWIAGLNVQRTHGLEMTRYTETAEVVASASVSHEVLRGLGYWFFYGRDRLGPWIEPGRAYTQWEPLIALTYLVPLLAIAGAAIARWRDRAFFVLMMVVGTALAVGAHPWDGGPPFARMVRDFQTTEAGLAMRSLPRAVPLVALATAVLVGAGIASLVRRWPRLGQPARWGGVALAVLALPPLWLGQFVPDNLRRPEDIPDHWEQAADHLDERDDGTRVLVVPGSDFAAYEWGSTVDPILPGLMDRASVQRETVPNGSPASANLLNAFDLGLQEGTADADSLAPVARLMRAGDMLVVGDWQYERSSTPEPQAFWDFVSQADGFDEPVTFDTSNVPGEAPDLAVLPVTDPQPLVTTHPTAGSLLVAGDGAGLVDAAAAGLIDGSELIRYSATLDEHAVGEALRDGAALLVTDSNRKRGERWNTLRHNRGYTEAVDDGALDTDLNDNRLPVFPDAGTDSMSVAVRRGGIDARATSYGNAITYVPEQRPTMAIDGDPATGWRTGAYSDARGERLELTLDDPVTTDRIRLLQPQDDVTRYITRVELRFDDADPVQVDLTEASQSGSGETVTFPERTFSRLSIEVVADSAGDLPRFASESGVGFSEVEIGEVANVRDPGREAVRLPTDLLETAGADSIDHPLALSLSRQRQDSSDPGRVEEEPALARLFSLPSERAFRLDGKARLSSRAQPEVIGELTGRPQDGSETWVLTDGFTAPGEIAPAVTGVFDGDLDTTWNTGFDPADQWVEVRLPEPVEADELTMWLVPEGRSLPTEMTLSVDGERVGSVEVPVIDPTEAEAAAEAGEPVPVELDLPEVSGSRFRLTVEQVDERRTGDDDEIILPVEIAELDLAEAPKVPELPDTFDSGCRDDLLQVDGEAVPLRVSGSMEDALAAGPLTVTPCGDQPELDLGGGEHRVESTPGAETGIDVDQLALRSGPGGDAAAGEGTLTAETDDATGGTSSGPTVEVLDEGDTDMRVEVSGTQPGEPFWLVLGESYNEGWSASPERGAVGDVELVDGFANGWLVTPDGDEPFEVQLAFEPQRRVDLALWVSLFAGLGCLVLAIRRPRLGARVAAAGGAAAEAGDAGNSHADADASAPLAYEPEFVLTYRGERPDLRTTLLVTVGVAALGWLLAGPAIGALVGLAAGAGARWPQLRRWVLAASAAALALAALYVLYIQLLHSPQPSLQWPFETRRAHPLGWLAVLLLATDVIVSQVRRRRRGAE